MTLDVIFYDSMECEGSEVLCTLWVTTQFLLTFNPDAGYHQSHFTDWKAEAQRRGDSIRPSQLAKGRIGL